MTKGVEHLEEKTMLSPNDILIKYYDGEKLTPEIIKAREKSAVQRVAVALDGYDTEVMLMD